MNIPPAAPRRTLRRLAFAGPARWRLRLAGLALTTVALVSVQLGHSAAPAEARVALTGVEPAARTGGGIDYTLLWFALATGALFAVALFWWNRRLAREIATRQRTEATLRETTAELDRFFNLTLDLLCIADTDGYFRRLNPQWEAVLGYASDALQGTRFLDLVHPDDLEATLQAVSHLDAQQPVLNFVNRYRCKDGSYRWIEWRSFASGKLIYAAARDITERKQAEAALRERETKLTSIFRAAPVGIGVVVNRVFQEVNDTLCGISGYAREQLVGRSARLVYPSAEEYERVGREKYRQIKETGTGTVETTWRRPDGQLIEVLLSSTPLDPDDLAKGVTFTALDITERKRAVEALFTSQRMLRSVLDTIPTRVFWKDRNSVYLGCNQAFARDCGLEDAAVIGKTDADLVTPALAQAFASVDRHIIETGEETLFFDDIIVLPDGKRRWQRTNKVPLRDRHGLVVGVLGTYEDITKQKEAETALRESEERFRHIFEHSRAVMLLIEPESGAIAEANPAAAAFYGYSRDRLRQMVIDDINILPPEEVKAARLQSASGVRDEIVFPHRLASGEIRTVEVRSSPVSVGGRPLLFSIVQDITKRQLAETKLVKSEQQQRLVWEGSLDGMRLVDANGIIRRVNDAYCRLVGMAPGDLEGKPFSVVYASARQEEMQGNFRRKFTTGEILPHSETQQTLWTGRVVDLELTNTFLSVPGQPVLLLTVFRDISARKQAEHALRASLEEKTVLLKEVHHRVKNNLQIVSSLLNLQARKVRNQEVQAFLRDTQSRIHAISLLHETLYASDNLARASFREYVRAVCTHIARSYAAETQSVRIRQDIADVRLPLDQAIPAGLILNELISNALKHAFTGRPDGTITVQLHTADARHYELRVADNGSGLPVGVGPAHGGTLGLRLVDNLVRQLEGQLTVQREAGTTFQVVFPIQHS